MSYFLTNSEDRLSVVYDDKRYREYSYKNKTSNDFSLKYYMLQKLFLFNENYNIMIMAKIYKLLLRIYLPILHKLRVS